VVKRGSAVTHHDEIWLEDLSLVVQVVDPEDRRSEEDEDLSLDAVERKHIERVLEMTKRNKKQACEILGISRPTLDRKIKAMDGEGARQR
jgi:transcriptional regulator with PAS, ATPase and Fis domain